MNLRSAAPAGPYPGAGRSPVTRMAPARPLISASGRTATGLPVASASIWTQASLRLIPPVTVISGAGAPDRSVSVASTDRTA
jgi:hypothetical protein